MNHNGNVPASIDWNAILDDLAERIAAKLRDQGASPRMRRLLSREAAAEYIGRTESGVDHLVASGAIPTVRADRRVMFDVRDLDAWIDANKAVLP